VTVENIVENIAMAPKEQLLLFPHSLLNILKELQNLLKNNYRSMQKNVTFLI